MHGYRRNIDEGGMGDSGMRSYADMMGKAMMLQDNIANLRKLLDEERQGLNQEREANVDRFKTLIHLPTCPMSDLAGIDSGCAVHGHLSERWNSLVTYSEPYVVANEVGHISGRDDRLGPMGDQEVNWYDIGNSYSTISPSAPSSVDEKPCPLPRPPPTTLLTGTESYMTRLLEVEGMCKQEMSRVNSIVPNLDHLNQLASDWVVESALSPDFGRYPSEVNVAQNIDDEDEEFSLSEQLKVASSELGSIEEFVSSLVSQ